MSAATVQRSATQSAVLSPVLAKAASRTHVQPKPVFQRDHKVPVRHGLGLFVLKGNWKFQKPSGPRASRRKQVNLVIHRETLQQDFFTVFPQPNQPEALQLAPWLTEETNPINWLQSATRLLDQLSLSLRPS